MHNNRRDVNKSNCLKVEYDFEYTVFASARGKGNAKSDSNGYTS